MISVLVAQAQKVKSQVKIETRPVGTMTKPEIIAQMKLQDPTLTVEECSCAINDLITDGTMKPITYVAGTAGCGSSIVATVYPASVGKK